MMRKLAAVAAACALTVGCAVDKPGGEPDSASPTNSMTTSSTTADSAGNPWDLPLEQRPALFDPCAEIPDSALAEAGFTPEQKDPQFTNHEPGEQMSCAWSNGDVSLLVIGSWRPRAETDNDSAYTAAGLIESQGHVGYKKYDAADSTNPGSIRVFYYTQRGAVSVSMNFDRSLREFRGNRFQDIDTVYEVTSPSIIRFLPEGMTE